MPDRLATLRQMPCVACANSPCDPHHEIAVGIGKMGGKADDERTMPLCRLHHNELHQDVRRFESIYGTQAEMIKKVNRWMEP